jgi:diguanylate cyclase (GGDEF)-like protein
MATKTNFPGYIAALRGAFAKGFRLGIGARLAIALTAVGALVLALNFLIEKVVRIERTTQITQFVPAPAAMPAAVPLTAPAAASDALPEPPRRTVTSDRVLLTLVHFDEAVRARVAMDNAQSTADYQRAMDDMNAALSEFIVGAASITAKSYAKLTAAFKLHQDEAAALISASGERQALSAKYAALFETLNARDKTSLDHSWKIFGRVIARQSLLQISTDLDALRRHAAAIGASGSSTGAKLTSLLEAEHTVQKDLDTNEINLRRTEGDAWYEAMRADLAGLVTMRGTLMQADADLDDRLQEFSQAAAVLSESIPRKIESQAKDPGRLAATRPARPERLEAPSAAPATVATGAASVPATVETHSVMTESPHDDSKRITIAWLSAGLLVILAYILVGTVISILRPVRSLLKATGQIARGDTNARVPRGGIKELDAVATAFNIMAEELSLARTAAQEYQQGLEVKVAERTLQLQHLAENDPLTGLPNRREWFILLNAAIARARPGGRQIGVFYLDIDNFKYINDSMGHAFGDRVLVSLSQRLQETTRTFGFAARFGGDEFTVVLENACDAESVGAAGLAIVQAFQQPLTVDNRELVVNVSVGASIYPDHAQEPEALLKAADVALFRAKSLGRCQLSMFTPDLLEVAEAKFSTEQGLRRAIERGEFELVFQPEIDVETLDTSLVEALIRWRMPDGTLALPSRFLGIAEESGLIIEIGDWVLRSAIEAAAHWHHGAWPEVRVAINVSARQFLDAGFVDRLQSLLRTYRLPPKCIEIELTESVLQTGPATIEALRRLRAHGVTIALDDFGTGYSSLASLEQLPLSRIKLDRTLLEGIDSSPRSAAIAHAIIAMCQGLGLQITAEGIERPEQFAMMLRHRGMCLQGYLLGRPTSRDELIPEMANVSQRARQLVVRLPEESESNVLEWDSPARLRSTS